MNRYAIWKYLTIALALLVGGLYTLPNLFGEAPAVQVSSAKPSRPLPTDLPTVVEAALSTTGLHPQASSFDTHTFKARFINNDEQLKAKDAIEKALHPNGLCRRTQFGATLSSLVDLFACLSHVLGTRFARWRSLHAPS